MNYLYFIIKKFFSYQLNIYRPNLYILYIWNVWNKNHIKKFYQDFTIVLIKKNLLRLLLVLPLLVENQFGIYFWRLRKHIFVFVNWIILHMIKVLKYFIKVLKFFYQLYLVVKSKMYIQHIFKKISNVFEKTASISIVKWRRNKYFNQITFKAILALIMRLKLVSHLNHNISMSSIY